MLIKQHRVWQNHHIIQMNLFHTAPNDFQNQSLVEPPQGWTTEWQPAVVRISWTSEAMNNNTVVVLQLTLGKCDSANAAQEVIRQLNRVQVEKSEVIKTWMACAEWAISEEPNILQKPAVLKAWESLYSVPFILRWPGNLFSLCEERWNPHTHVSDPNP